MPSFIIENRIHCRRCDSDVVSTHVHDFRYCRCRAVAVDGGNDYLRRVGERCDFEERSLVADREARGDIEQSLRDYREVGEDPAAGVERALPHDVYRYGAGEIEPEWLRLAPQAPPGAVYMGGGKMMSNEAVRQSRLDYEELRVLIEKARRAEESRKVAELHNARPFQVHGDWSAGYVRLDIAADQVRIVDDRAEVYVTFEQMTRAHKRTPTTETPHPYRFFGGRR